MKTDTEDDFMTEVVGGMIATLLMAVIVIGWNVLIGRIVYKKLFKNPQKASLYMFLFFFLAPFAVIIAMIMASNKLNKEREKIYSSLTHSPNNSNVDMLIKFLEKYGCTDTPNAWHQLRGVWYACNRSSNISPDKKEELLTYLLLKGLYLNNEERKIIK